MLGILPRLGPRQPTAEDEAECAKQLSQIVREAQRRLKQQRNLMHYRNGREAKNGDKVVQFSIEGGNLINVGVLFDARPGNDYCNGSIAPISPNVSGACMCDCLHLDDLADLLKEKGLDKRPFGK